MDYKNDKLFLQLIWLRDKEIGIISIYDKDSYSKHKRFLTFDKKINYDPDSNELIEILTIQGYIDKVVNLKDVEHVANNKLKESSLYIRNITTNKTKDGLDFYMSNSESTKNNKELENQFFITIKNYWWVIAVISGSVYLLITKWNTIKTFLE